MKKLLTYTAATVALVGVLSIALPANAAAPSTAPGQNKLQCFDGTTDGGYNGVCTMQGNGARGPATLNNVDNDSDPYNNYSGVYVLNSDVYGMTLGSVKKLSFNYTGEATAGSPRFSIPVDTNGDGTTDQWAFVSAYYCNDGFGTVNAISDPTCTIYTGAESFANWTALVAAHPTWKVATDNYAFIIADDPGVWTVNAVKFNR